MQECAAQLRQMNPAQMKYQANVMRRDPAYARRQNPQLAHMNDEQIRQAADQMEQMADNPQMREQAAKHGRVDAGKYLEATLQSAVVHLSAVNVLTAYDRVSRETAAA